MVEMTLTLDENTASMLEQVVAIEYRSPSEVVACAITEHAARALRPLPLGIGACRSGRFDVSVRAEEILRRNL